MRNRLSGYKLVLAGILSIALYSCERSNGIDNNNVILKPYSLLVSDSAGLLLKSNDGSNYSLSDAKTNDEIPMRAIATAGNNIIIIKNNAFVSENDGNTFNPISVSVQASPATFNQSMVLDAQGGFNRIYMASSAGSGIIYSDSAGVLDSWKIDGTFDQSIAPGFTVTSFTQLSTYEVFGLDPANKRLFMKKDRDSKWVEIGMGGFPGTTSAALYLSHFGKTLIIADFLGSGIWYSQNNGASWTAYTGLPPVGTATFNCVTPVFDQTVLVGTSNGVYRYDPSTGKFEAANLGLAANTTVRSIVAKDRVYKNEDQNNPSSALFIFMATHTGVYRSQDLGQNWFLVRAGKYTAIY